MEDPITADWPSRVPIEEDEEEAESLIEQYAVQPELALDVLQGASPTIAVVLVGQAAAVLAGTLLRLEAQEGAGCISVPELRRFHSPRQAEELGSDRPVVNRCRVQAVEGSPIALVECPRPVPAQQANTWARAVLPALQRAGVERVLVVATLQAMAYRGPADPEDGDVLHSLFTSAAAAAAPPPPGAPPPLPAGSAVDGLPAALVARCELAGVPAAVVVGVQAQPAADAGLVLALARATRAVLQGWGHALPAAPGEAELRKAVGKVVDDVYRSSAGQSIFI